jgi:nucleoside-diphosphate-sugar epimerase
MDFTFSSQKAHRDFEFQPKYSLEQSMQNTIDYYARNKG